MNITENNLKSTYNTAFHLYILHCTTGKQLFLLYKNILCIVSLVQEFNKNKPKIILSTRFCI